MIEKCRYNDVGVGFVVTIKDNGVVVDLTGHTTLELVFRKPDGSRLVKAAVLADAPTLGKIKYVSIDGDLKQIGTWRIQGHIKIPSGEYRSDLGSFIVEANL